MKKVNSKAEAIALLRDELNTWENILANMTQAQIHAPIVPSHWSTKDVVAHLWAWQLRSNARLEAATTNTEPRMPEWPVTLDPEVPEEPDELNAWIYEQYRDKPWPDVYQDWQNGYLKLMSLGEALPEADLLEVSKYPWLEGYSMADVLASSADHHEEHREWLVEWLNSEEAG